MVHFLAERYVPPADRAAVAFDAGRIRAAAARVPTVRLLQTVYLPADELCLYLFEGESAERVALLGRLAELQLDRIRRAEVDA